MFLSVTWLFASHGRSHVTFVCTEGSDKYTPIFVLSVQDGAIAIKDHTFIMFIKIINFTMVSKQKVTAAS